MRKQMINNQQIFDDYKMQTWNKQQQKKIDKNK